MNHCEAYFPYVNGLAIFNGRRHQAFTRDRCNIFPRLSYNKTNNTFLNSLKKNDVEAHVEFTVNEKLWKGLWSPVIDVSVKKNSLLVYAINYFWNFGRSVW